MQKEVKLCFQHDLKLIDKPYWIAKLSNQTDIYYDEDVSQYWLHLKNYLREAKLFIHHIYAIFRTVNTQVVPLNAEGYLFHRAGASYNGVFADYFIFGWVAEGRLKTGRWMLPTLEFAGFEEKDINKYAGQIIWQNESRTTLNTKPATMREPT